jgi:hypothetical protein
VPGSRPREAALVDERARRKFEDEGYVVARGLFALEETRSQIWLQY